MDPADGPLTDLPFFMVDRGFLSMTLSNRSRVLPLDVDIPTVTMSLHGPLLSTSPTYEACVQPQRVVGSRECHSEIVLIFSKSHSLAYGAINYLPIGIIFHQMRF